jgi:UDP-GlcNAc:undecaprenyl-phosphate/decaprenyl-phosphate GlcNAc-1-phosphate transferase
VNLRIPGYILVALVAAYLTYIFIPIIKSYCVKRGLLDKPGPRKIHTVPTPRMGGVAFVISYSLAIWLGFVADPSLWQDNWFGIFGTILGGIIIFLLGLTDDVKGVKPSIKFLWQVTAALFPVLCGVRLDLVNIPYYKVVSLGYWGIPFSILWVVAITNTFNLLDGLDGLAAGIASISALTFVILSVVLNLPIASLLAAGILGVSVAFLRFNYHPAQIFMGDSGSLFIGYILGVLSLYWPKSYASLVMFVPILALGVPLLEVITTTFRRLITGQKIYMADRRHLFHYLLEQGFSHQGVVWFFYIISIQFSIMAVGFVVGKANIILVLEAVFVIFIGIILSRRIKAGGGNGR